MPGAVISGGASQAEDVGNYLTATGSSQAGVKALNNAVVARLRNGGAIDPDGVVDVKKLDAWTTKHADTLGQIPALRDALADAGTAQRTLNAAAVANRTEAAAYRDGIARRFLNGQDPHQAVYGALSGRNSARNFNAIIDGVSGDKSALASLQQHVVDFLLDRFAPESTAPGGMEGGERGMLQARGFRAWMDNNKTPLRRLFGGPGLQNLELVAESLRRATPPASAIAGSQTTPNFFNAARSGLHAVTHGKGVGYTVMALLGEHLAEASGSHALLGVVGGVVGKAVLDRLAATGMRTVNDLVGAAYLHP